jgi:hypothetical protein
MAVKKTSMKKPVAEAAAKPSRTSAGAPTHEQIAQRAYELFLQRGAQHGRDYDDWLIAETELAATLTRSTRRAAPRAESI